MVSYILLATVLSNALCLLSSLDVRNQSSGSYKWVIMWGGGGGKEEILSILFYYFGSQIFDLANIPKNLLDVLSSVFVVFNGGGT